MTVAEVRAKLLPMPDDAPVVVARIDGAHYIDILDIVSVMGWPPGQEHLAPMVLIRLEGGAK